MKGEWTSVEDNPPDTAEQVLVTISNGIDEPYVDNDVYYYDGADWWNCGSSNLQQRRWTKFFTHWMPLPDPAKQREERKR